MRKYKRKSCPDGDFERQKNERTHCNCFRCGSVYNITDKIPKPPKDNTTRQKNVCFNKRGNQELQEESENCDDDTYQDIYASMTRNLVVGVH